MLDLIKELLSKTADGCHKYGWMLNIIVTLVTLAYFLGGLTSTIDGIRGDISDTKARITRVESQVYELAHEGIVYRNLNPAPAGGEQK